MMAEYIEREEYCKKHCQCNNEYCDKSCPIWKAPAADVAPVVHGTWELRQEGPFVSVYRCSVCGRQESIGNSILYDSAAMMVEKYPYCHCGARMDGKLVSCNEIDIVIDTGEV